MEKRAGRSSEEPSWRQGRATEPATGEHDSGLVPVPRACSSALKEMPSFRLRGAWLAFDRGAGGAAAFATGQNGALQQLTCPPPPPAHDCLFQTRSRPPHPKLRSPPHPSRQVLQHENPCRRAPPGATVIRQGWQSPPPAGKRHPGPSCPQFIRHDKQTRALRCSRRRPPPLSPPRALERRHAKKPQPCST